MNHKVMMFFFFFFFFFLHTCIYKHITKIILECIRSNIHYISIVVILHYLIKSAMRAHYPSAYSSTLHSMKNVLLSMIGI